MWNVKSGSIKRSLFKIPSRIFVGYDKKSSFVNDVTKIFKKRIQFVIIDD